MKRYFDGINEKNSGFKIRIINNSILLVSSGKLSGDFIEEVSESDLKLNL